MRIHGSALQAAESYSRERGRAVYITPARCRQALVIFESIVTAKASRLAQEREQYLAGIRKLDEANTTIDRLQEQLERLGPELEAKSAAVEAGMAVLEREARDVEETQRAVGAEASQVAAQKAGAEALKRECELRLAEAQPLYEAALVALRTLKVADFVTMKSFLAPPQPIRLALEAACIMLGVKPRMVDLAVGKGGQTVKVPDYWEKSRKLLSDYKKFLLSLEKYEKDNIPPERIAEIQKYLIDPEFAPEKIRKASEAAEGICKWVLAVCKYDTIAKDVRPRRAALEEAEAQLAVTESEFKVKQDELAAVVARRDALAEAHARSMAERQSLLAQRDLCLAKLQRASSLMASLGSERTGWLAASRSLAGAVRAVVGDSVLAACSIAYLGPFEASARQELLEGRWKPMVDAAPSVAASPRFDLRAAVGDPARIQSWLLSGLPDDRVSTENMLILEATASERWPVLIDP